MATKTDANKRYALWLIDCRCVWCGRALEFREATLEHLRPRVHGGTNEKRNLAIACLKCNNQRGDAIAADEVIAAITARYESADWTFVSLPALFNPKDTRAPDPVEEIKARWKRIRIKHRPHNRRKGGTAVGRGCAPFVK